MNIALEIKLDILSWSNDTSNFAIVDITQKNVIGNRSGKNIERVTTQLKIKFLKTFRSSFVVKIRSIAKTIHSPMMSC